MGGAAGRCRQAANSRPVMRRPLLGSSACRAARLHQPAAQFSKELGR
jgi:hypothetical protein